MFIIFCLILCVFASIGMCHTVQIVDEIIRENKRIKEEREDYITKMIDEYKLKNEENEK